jgi:tetratricopeptide (TPR) repeat protein
VQTLPEVGLQARPMSPEEVALLLAELQPWDDKRGVQRAETLIQLAEEARSTRAKAMVLRAALHLRQGDHLQASSVLRRAHEEDPADADVLAALLGVQLGSGEPSSATRHRFDDWLGALLAHATRAHHFAIASAWQMQLDHDPYAALRSALRAIELDGTNLFGYWVAGDAYRSLGELPAALEAYQAALALSGHLVDENRRTLESEIAAVRAMLEE